MRDDYRSSEEEFADAGFAIDRSQSVFGDAPADDYDMGGDAEDIADDAEEEE